ncbi:MAG: peptidase S1, partial [Actinomycetota bacterium]|nr:peptidase S1 [Actinomycetota bacterium]
MTDDPRYSQSQQSGQRVPNQQPAPGYPRAGYSQQYDWRSGHAQQPYDPYRAARSGTTAVMPPMVAEPPRRRGRPFALAAGALAISVVSAGVGGMVAVMAQ